ncbi:PEROXIDASE_4 domain-containing protein [Nephila pilipes]|uniref:PEROXIDASE_4 domain-containing protein n=1 Tax=Nephila pilipes TaxID=299642 RepID=A0A8X6MQ41_NEPPI|nr:PEROXIDASE_4 domain-containing protein [Nephila pilipes]
MESYQESKASTKRKGSEIVSIASLFKGYGDKLQNIETEGLSSLESQSFIIDMGQLVASVYDNIVETIPKEEIEKFNYEIVGLSHRYQRNPDLSMQITNWCKCRKRLIKMAISTANELDSNTLAVSIGRLIGSSVEFLNSLNFGIYEELRASFTATASNYSPSLGLLMDNVFQLAPHLGYMGIISSLFDVFRSETVIKRVATAMKEDEDKFEPLKTWFEETNEFDASVKQLFPYEIDKELINAIEKNLKDLEDDRKVFASIFISNVVKNQKLLSNDTFLSKVFLFSRSEAAAEWYSRMINDKKPVGQESALLYFRNELRELEKISPDSGSSIELGLVSLKANTLPRLVLTGLNAMSVVHCWRRVMKEVKPLTKTTISATMGARPLNNTESALEEFSNYMGRFDTETISSYALEGPHNINSKLLVTDMIRMVESVYETLVSKLDPEEVERFLQTINRLSSDYREDRDLLKQFTDWCECREKLITKLQKSADELDRNTFIVMFGRIIGSSLQLLDLFNMAIKEEIRFPFSVYVSNKSPILGIVMETLLHFSPHLGFISLICTIGEKLMVDIIVRQVVTMIRRDIKKFEPIQKWFKETDALNASIDKLFPHEIDRDIVRSIEEVLADLRNDEKIFAAIFFSNIRINKKLFKDGRFLSKAFRFCRSDGAKEWYKRMPVEECPFDQENGFTQFRNELRELERLSPDSGSTAEIDRFCGNSILPRPVLAILNGFFMYYCYRRMQNGAVHMYSDFKSSDPKGKQFKENYILYHLVYQFLKYLRLCICMKSTPGIILNL